MFKETPNVTITINQLNDNVLEDAESSVLSLAMESTRYNQTKAAKILGISRRTLRSKLKKYYGNKYVGGSLDK